MLRRQKCALFRSAISCGCWLHQWIGSFLWERQELVGAHTHKKRSCSPTGSRHVRHDEVYRWWRGATEGKATMALPGNSHDCHRRWLTQLVGASTNRG